MSQFSRRTVLAATAIALLSFTSTACVGGAEAGSHGGGQLRIRIAYQAIPNADLVVKNQRLLEKALPDAEIQWVKFESGGDVNTAVIAGSVDLGLVGSSPVAKGLSAPLNIPYKVAWIHDLIGDNEALVAKKNIPSITALRGRRIATPFGSTAHYSLLAALESAGLKATDVTLVDLQPQDALAAWQRGDIDAAYVWAPSLTELKKNGRVLASSRAIGAQGKPTADLGVVTTTFAQRHPEALNAWLKAQDQAVALAKTDPAKAAVAIGAELNLEPAEAKKQLAELVLLSAKEQQALGHLGKPDAPGKLAAALRDAALFLQSQKAVETVPDLAVFEKALAVEELSHATR
ncbi:glycine betaine ABC transporter substrate-binding protein [Streptomyces sp. NPDC051776]|uniref:taurine ABC transporter substrate-binding protein n=1 Tax=Streptomyces sp. NPDC051776 TaxID=3155414 RepID=UPI003423FA63